MFMEFTVGAFLVIQHQVSSIQHQLGNNNGLKNIGQAS